MNTILRLLPLLVVALWFGTVEGRQPPPSTFALRGTVVTANEALASGVVEIEGGRIKTVGSTGTANAVEVDGVIVPGLIDLHNHLTWNVLPRWTPATRYNNRWEWQEDVAYILRLSGPHSALMAGRHGCDMNRYAEVKAIVNGATAGVGGFANNTQNACIAGLMRNLDLASDLPGGSLNKERLRNVIFPFESDPAAEDAIRTVDPAASDSSDAPRAIVMHVAEGIDAAARREFRMLRAHDYLKPGVSVTHATAFTAPQFAELAAKKVGVIWSPRSNVELYGRTADIAAAKTAGVTIAIAPDWSPTGSTGMLHELSTAWAINTGTFPSPFSDVDMFKMSTSNPASLAALSSQIGSLAPGLAADLLVLRRKGTSAYQSLVRSTPADVLLVVVGGRALYGDPALMARLLPGTQLETITLCGESKALNVSDGVAAQSFAQVSGRLQAALKSVGSSLAPLAECE